MTINSAAPGVTKRDWCLTKYGVYGEQESYAIVHSVERPDVPPNPQYIRAEIIGTHRLTRLTLFRRWVHNES